MGYLEHGGGMLLSSERDAAREYAYIVGKYRALGGPRVHEHWAGFARWAALLHRRAGRRFRAASVYLRMGLLHHDPGCLARAAVMPFGEGAMTAARGVAALVGRRPEGLGAGPLDEPTRAPPPWLAEALAG
jgi:hypothetical protein